MAINGVPTSFGSFTFPEEGIFEFKDNFKTLRPSNIKLPGMDGAWPEDGHDAPPTEPGLVTIGWYDAGTGKESLDAIRDQVAEMASAGEQILTYQPSKPGDPPRFCMARVKTINDPQSVRDNSEHFQKFQVIFEINYPRWLINNHWGFWLGYPGLYLGQPGLVLGGFAYEVLASGLETTGTLPYVGNARAPVKITIEPQAGQSCQNPKIQRVNGLLVLDEFQYTGIVAAGHVLTISGSNQWATYDADDIWQNFTYLDIDFYRAEPDFNDFKISFANAGDAATVRFYFFDEFR